MSVADDLHEVLDKMPEAVVPEKAANINADIQLELTGEAGGQWVININNGQVAIEEGTVEFPKLTLTMAASDFVAISMGEANAMNLFMAGKIKVQGDITLAMKFQDLFDRDRVT